MASITQRNRSDFINFIIDTEKKPKLVRDFLSKKSQTTLYNFFQAKGYKDIPYNDCKDILTAKKNWKVPDPNPSPIPPPCPSGQKVY